LAVSRGRFLFGGMIYAPLVMPEVITGLSLLLLFVAIDVDRGFWTITVAHTTLTMCFVAVIVQARLVDFDRSLEEAAMDLGCPPIRTFFTITLPLIAPAIAQVRARFTLSLDDLILASFTTGPGATTLPIRIYSGDPSWCEAGDQRRLHDPDRGRGGGAGGGLAHGQALGRAKELRADRRAVVSIADQSMIPKKPARAGSGVGTAFGKDHAQMRGFDPT